MAYLRESYMDKNGRNNENAYTHIESYSVNVDKKVSKINLVTYVSEEARDLKYEPIEREREIIKGVDYDNMFGENSLIEHPTTRNSDNLRIIYEKLNEKPKWKADGVKPVFEKMIKDVGERKKDEEISKKIAADEGLAKGEDYKSAVSKE